MTSIDYSVLSSNMTDMLSPYHMVWRKHIFKRRLDKYLSTIPDEPHILGYTAQRRADSNSILDMWGKFLNAHWPSQVEVFGDLPSGRGCANSVAGVQ